MAGATAYYTSADLIAAVKRKISFPTSQATFTELDILAFCNEEMMVSQVPSVLQYHQEYFVYTVNVPLLSNKNKYPIPDRAIGMKLRNLFWLDQNGNPFEMSRIQEEDKAFYNRNIGANEAIAKYYLQGNDVILTPGTINNPTGQLNFEIFLRPNQLVMNNRAANITAFTKNITMDNSTLNIGDILTIATFNAQGAATYYTFTAASVVANPGDFLIGTSSVDTATNLSLAILASGAFTNSSNGTPSTQIVTLTYSDLNVQFTSVTAMNQPAPGMVVQAGQGVQFDAIPSTWQNPVTLINEPLFQNNILIDFLQTKPGHRIRSYDILIPQNGITGLIINFSPNDVPEDLIIGDYICLANESIIPYLPPDLHNGLAERAAARILAALGDQIGLSMSQAKINDINTTQGNLLDNRVDGSPLKVTGRKTLLRYGKLTSGRRY